MTSLLQDETFKKTHDNNIKPRIADYPYLSRKKANREDASRSPTSVAVLDLRDSVSLDEGETDAVLTSIRSVPEILSSAGRKTIMSIASNLKQKSCKHREDDRKVTDAKAAVTDDCQNTATNPFLFFAAFLQHQRTIRKKSDFERRLSRTLILLEGAREASSSEVSRIRRYLRTLGVGDLGLALFSPLDVVCDEEKAEDQQQEEHEEEEKQKDEGKDNDLLSNHEPINVSVETEPAEILSDSPHVLSHTAKQKIHSSLPWTLQHQRWCRVYSASRDGDSFDTFLHKVTTQRYSKTVVVVKTTRGSIFGGFADSPWERQRCDGASFYGTGTSFLFAIEGGNDDVVDDDVNVLFYKWTGMNHFNQFLHADEGRIAMGGGGTESSFGFCVEDYFTRGSTGACDTYNNPPLTTTDGLYFDVLDFEVYGFKTIAMFS